MERSIASLWISAAGSRFAHARWTPQLAEKIRSLYTGSFPVKGVLAPGATVGRGGCMGRFGSLVGLVIILFFASLLPGCGSSTSSVTTNTSSPIPAKLSLSPTPTASLEVGNTLSFTGTAEDNKATAITETVSYQSSNPAILTISTGGLACAGSWDSLSSPAVCTPGPVGVAQVTAVAHGVSSPPTTVYVHQHIDSITISPVPTQTPPTASCFSAASTTLQLPAQSFDYQATALSHGLDITSTVGLFSWQAASSSVVTLATATVSSPIAGLQPGQVQATANTPGLTQIYASVGGTTSLPFDFMTCPVQSIALTINSAPVSQITLARSGTQTVLAVVTDTRGIPISGSFLTWCSSEPSSVSTSATNCGGPTGAALSMTVTAAQAGGGSAVIASCTPPVCNIGLLPSTAIYPQAALQVIVNAATTSTSNSDALWVTSTDCGTMIGCTTSLIPVTFTYGSTTTAASSIGTTVSLPATPNSLVFNGQGTRAYLGTDSTALSTKGLMVLDPSANTVTEYPTAGKVLAVSPDGTAALVSNTVETPNQVYVFSCTGTSGACGSTNVFPLNITGATAAAFSPDGLKAYILAGSTLSVFSKIDAVQTIALAAPATDVAFLANGGVGYMAGGDPAGVSFLPVCDSASSAIGNVSVPTAGFIRALPDGKTMLALTPPNIQTFTVGITGTGCAAPRPFFAGFLTVTNTPNAPVNLGQGNFVPSQLIISPDGLTAYVVASNSGNVLAFNINAQTTSAMPLKGNVLPVGSSLNIDGSKLYVAASDGMIHVLDTLTAVDSEQISFPNNLPQLQGGLCVNVAFVCNPNLIGVKP
jgi:hypothetical protein